MNCLTPAATILSGFISDNSGRGVKFIDKQTDIWFKPDIKNKLQDNSLASIAEILTLLLILSCILILPRMLKQENKEEKTKLNPRNFSIYHRFAIFISVMLPVIMALLIKPWKTDLILFIFVGVLPVAVLWGIIWMAAGFKK